MLETPFIIVIYILKNAGKQNIISLPNFHQWPLKGNVINYFPQKVEIFILITCS